MPYIKYDPRPGECFGRLTVITTGLRVTPSPSQILRGHGGHRALRVRCSCGTEKTVMLSNLINGSVRSCGCLRSRKSSGGQS